MLFYLIWRQTLSGNKSVDQPKAMYLCELALDFARQTLNPGGVFIKVFQGEGFDEFFQALRTDFSVLKTRKPNASRSQPRNLSARYGLSRFNPLNSIGLPK